MERESRNPMEIRLNRIRSPIIWLLLTFLALLLSYVIRPVEMGVVYASTGGFTSAGVHFIDTGDGYLTATSHVDGSVRSGFSSNHMMVHYFDSNGSQIGSAMISIALDYYSVEDRTDTITVRYSEVIGNAPSGTVRATLDQCVILLNGKGRGTYFLYDNVTSLTEREKLQFDLHNSGEYYMSASELNSILNKVHAYVPEWNPMSHRYEVFDYVIDLPEGAYSEGVTEERKTVELRVRAGTGIGETYGSGTYYVGDSPVYGGKPLTGYNAPEPVTLENIQESTTVTVYGIPWNHQVDFELNGGSGDFPSFVEKTGGRSYLPAGVPYREGYTFAGWKVERVIDYLPDGSGSTEGTNAVVGEVLSPGARYGYRQNGGRVILVAQWKVNSYELIYHQNGDGADRTVSQWIQWEELDETAIGTTSGVIGPTVGVYGIDDVGFTAPLASSDDGRRQTFTGWDMARKALKPHQANEISSMGVEISRHLNQQGTVRLSTIVRAADVVDQPGSRIHIYAVWDDVPEYVEVDNLYFTSDEADAGITQEMLFLAITGRDGSSARVFDPEDGVGFTFRSDLSGTAGELWKTGPSDSVWLECYDVSEFQNLGERGAVPVRFVMVDWAGNTRTAETMVYITNSNVRDSDVYVRLIDQENYSKSDANNGGLSERSIWKLDPEANRRLRNCL